jgi:hypothetical protein
MTRNVGCVGRGFGNATITSRSLRVRGGGFAGRSGFLFVLIKGS